MRDSGVHGDRAALVEPAHRYPQTKTGPESETTTATAVDGIGAVDVSLLKTIREDDAVSKIGGLGLCATAAVQLGARLSPPLDLRQTDPGQYQAHKEPAEQGRRLKPRKASHRAPRQGLMQQTRVAGH